MIFQTKQHTPGTLYRIIQNNDGVFLIQRKSWYGWVDALEDCCCIEDDGYSVTFKSVEGAEKYLQNTIISSYHPSLVIKTIQA